MNGLSLCAGIGGLDLGLHLALPQYRTICYVEKEAYCQEILLARMADGLLDRGALWDDVTTFSAGEWKGCVDIVHGGYPCQPFSIAGKRQGERDERHLWPHIQRIVSECEPEWCFFENVAGHLTLGFDVVARSLEDMGYQVAAGLFTAAEVGAPHRRQRLYILARRRQGYSMADPGCVGEHADESRRSGGPCGSEAPVLGSSSETVAYSAECANEQSITRPTEWGFSAPDGRSTGDMGYADNPRLEGRREPEREGPDELAWPPGPEERDLWADIAISHSHLLPATEPRGERSEATPQSAVCRVADGLPHRMDRLKALGNAVVPDVAALAWRTLYRELNRGH